MPRAVPDDLRGVLLATDEMVQGGVTGDVDDPGRMRNLFAADRGHAVLAVPAGGEGGEQILDVGREIEPDGQHLGDFAHRGDVPRMSADRTRGSAGHPHDAHGQGVPLTGAEATEARSRPLIRFVPVRHTYTVTRFPWKELAPAAAALVALAVAWAIARGTVDEAFGSVVNAAAGAVAAVVIAWSAVVGKRTAATRAAPAELSGELRSALMDRVRSRWIGTRDGSGRLTGAAKLAKDLALGYELPTLLVPSKESEATGRADVLTAWKRSGHGMMLTGTAGAGKSVQLLLLAEKLLNQASRDPAAGVPVVLSLAAWRSVGRQGKQSDADGRPFEDWLVSEIHAHYRIPLQSARTWLVQGALIPILDGLDETNPGSRPHLFEELAEWVRDENLPPAAWAVGCREQEFAELDPDRNQVGTRSTYWTVMDLDAKERVRFLKYARAEVNSGWQPVIDALEQGRARHLTRIDGDERGVLATPLGLVIAVEAYRPDDDLKDQPQPAELLEPGGGWDRLWARYVSHQYRITHRDPDDESGPADQYTFEQARRWLATLASEKAGIMDLIDVRYLLAPKRPDQWARLWGSSAGWGGPNAGDIFEVLYGILVIWTLVLAAFGALASGLGWAGVTGALAALAVLLGLCAAYAVGFTVHFGRQVAGLLSATLALVGLPGMLLMGSGLSWPGEPVIRWLQPIVSGLAGFGIHIGEVDLRLGHIWLGGWGEGLVTGAAVGLTNAVVFGLVSACLVIAWLIATTRRRNRRTRKDSSSGLVDFVDRYLWWLDDFDEEFERWLARRVLLRWWYYGSPLGFGQPTGLVPPPNRWDDFLFWASHHGYLRRVGDQHVWMHDTLRTWFARHRDAEALSALGAE